MFQVEAPWAALPSGFLSFRLLAEDGEWTWGVDGEFGVWCGGSAATLVGIPRSVFTWSCAYTESRDWVLRCCAPGFRFSGESVAHSFASFLLILRLTHVWKAPSGQQFLPVFASFESSRIDVLRMLKMRVPSWTP